jgi:hypothetical protein
VPPGACSATCTAGVCGTTTCPAGQTCHGGTCVAPTTTTTTTTTTTCAPDCANKCGGVSDGCGGTCPGPCTGGVCCGGNCVAGAVCCTNADCAGSGASVPRCVGGGCCELGLGPGSVCSTLPCCFGRTCTSFRHCCLQSGGSCFVNDVCCSGSCKFDPGISMGQCQ